jgi:hypothetical protein
VTNAGGLNVDSDILGLSVQDVGSGVLAFIAVFVALTLWARGLATIFVDRFA